jgi:hypothetical protein
VDTPNTVDLGKLLANHRLDGMTAELDEPKRLAAEGCIIVCMRADLAMMPVKGSVEVACYGCGEKVIMSPSTQVVVALNPANPVLCFECLVVLYQNEKT